MTENIKEQEKELVQCDDSQEEASSEEYDEFNNFTKEIKDGISAVSEQVDTVLKDHGINAAKLGGALVNDVKSLGTLAFKGVFLLGKQIENAVNAISGEGENAAAEAEENADHDPVVEETVSTAPIPKDMAFEVEQGEDAAEEKGDIAIEEAKTEEKEADTKPVKKKASTTKTTKCGAKPSRTTTSSGTAEKKAPAKTRKTVKKEDNEA